MMISPKSYLDNHRDKDFEQLIKERDSLIKSITSLERIVFNEDRSGDAWKFHPGPDVKYQMELDYLSELCRFMSNKYNQEHLQ